jgi:hypothetical protein
MVVGKETPLAMRSVLVALISTVVIAGVVGCDTASTSQPSASNAATSASSSAAATTSPAQPTAAAGAQSCAALGGRVGTDQTCHVHIATASYEIDFSFPVDYPDQQALMGYLTQQRHDFVDFVTELPKRDFPYALDAKATAYRSGTPTSGTESLVFTVYSDSGAHPVTGYEAFTYDLGKGAPITLDILFKPGTQPVEVLDPIVRRELEKRWQGSGSPVPDNTLGAKVYQNFAITDDAVIFFIGQGQWLPQAGGPQKVSVPRTELASLLA